MFKIAIASGKGGTGKTFVATNIFYTLMSNQIDAVLVDCDAEAPNAVAFFDVKLNSAIEVTHLVPVIDTNKCTFCGKCHEYCNYNAIFMLPPSKIINVIEDLCHGCGACSVACDYDAISEKPFPLGNVTSYSYNNSYSLIEARMNIGVMSPVSVIKAAIKQIKVQTGITVLDSPPGTSCPFIQTVEQSDYVILVTEPTPFGLSDLRQSVETLKAINKKFGVIINRAGLGNTRVQEYLDDENIPLLLEIPYKKEIAELYSTGKLVSESDPFFGQQLLAVVENILKQNGNSNNKR
ncbi:MAG TPA: cobyrinic acid a,c-diamide synthase [Bacteroidales bacterium]|nr:cobyrinic acid a,c-diamide synthase [Bacteroidales bacterium]